MALAQGRVNGEPGGPEVRSGNLARAGPGTRSEQFMSRDGRVGHQKSWPVTPPQLTVGSRCGAAAAGLGANVGLRRSESIGQLFTRRRQRTFVLRCSEQSL